MGTSNSLAEAASKVGRVGDVIERLPRTTGHAVGKVGKSAVLDLARDVFGADRKFSGAKRSKKARRIAGASYALKGDLVEVYPTGDPFYIFMKGRRGGKRIYPRRKGVKAIGGPGGPRRYAIVGTLSARKSLLDPAIRKIQRQAPEAILKGFVAQAGKVLG